MPEDTEVPKGPSDNLKLQNEHFLRVAGTFSPCCGDMEFPQQIYNECMWIQNWQITGSEILRYHHVS